MGAVTRIEYFHVGKWRCGAVIRHTDGATPLAVPALSPPRGRQGAVAPVEDAVQAAGLGQVGHVAENQQVRTPLAQRRDQLGPLAGTAT